MVENYGHNIATIQMHSFSFKIKFLRAAVAQLKSDEKIKRKPNDSGAILNKYEILFLLSRFRQILLGKSGT
jgi:hypothetical protein